MYQKFDVNEYLKVFLLSDGRKMLCQTQELCTYFVSFRIFQLCNRALSLTCTCIYWIYLIRLFLCYVKAMWYLSFDFRSTFFNLLLKSFVYLLSRIGSTYAYGILLLWFTCSRVEQKIFQFIELPSDAEIVFELLCFSLNMKLI